MGLFVDGFVFIVDREKDMYITGGENVYPAEVENILYQLDEIAELAIIGIPDKKWGETGKLFVVLKENRELPKEKIIEHLDIIYKDILSIFKKNQIEEISALGEKLDPNKHQAMLEIEDADKEQGIVVQEIQKGFTLKGRLLRPSLVGVSKKPQKILLK